MAKGFGWRPDTPDKRDYSYEPLKTNRRLPRSVDLSERFFTVWNQGSLGSCTAHAVGAAALFQDLNDRDMSIVVPSRHFVYYNTRLIEGNTGYDSGAEIRNAIKSLVRYGYPSEDLEPYRIRDFAQKPKAQAYRTALRERVKRYERVQRSLNHFRRLLSQGIPISFGFSVYHSIYQGKVERTGLVPVPKKSENLEGGHAVLIVGYDDERQCLIFRNSWGRSWGRRGYGFLPYEYLLDPNLSDDFWAIF